MPCNSTVENCALEHDKGGDDSHYKECHGIARQRPAVELIAPTPGAAASILNRLKHRQATTTLPCASQLLCKREKPGDVGVRRPSQVDVEDWHAVPDRPGIGLLGMAVVDAVHVARRLPLRHPLVREERLDVVLHAVVPERVVGVVDVPPDPLVGPHAVAPEPGSVAVVAAADELPLLTWQGARLGPQRCRQRRRPRLGYVLEPAGGEGVLAIAGCGRCVASAQPADRRRPAPGGGPGRRGPEGEDAPLVHFWQVLRLHLVHLP
eukprot:CAMPEP_0179279066 /NCGR_PEP_ID=MMETSP0797-20121207/35924_1 /TAXON_ID=47934 /ORGANISM="Dinophysis acuminata, Strain DAEP01" /LENGTH=263 /DNA_ID=CAMNT_0020987687 /DNA_START=26 /DNA_END=815 /DNA_ORIENTATION=-